MILTIPNRLLIGAAPRRFRPDGRAVRIVAIAALLVANCRDAPTGVALLELRLTPQTVSTQPGKPIQFTVNGRFNDQADHAVPVTYTVSPATGAAIDAAGVFTAAVTGVFTVTAHASGLSANATVTVTTAPVPPPPPPPSGSYAPYVSDDWQSYNSSSDLRAADVFWWDRTEDVYDYVHMVSDATFGKVVRVTFKAHPETGWSPKIDVDFDQPIARMWFRWRVKWEPGWTTRGTYPTGYANAWKMAFWLWDVYQERGQIEFTNTTEYNLGLGMKHADGTRVTFAETLLPGSQNWDHVTTEWSDGEWWEYVVYYDRISATSAKQHWWRRRLTTGGTIANNAFTYAGISVTNASSALPLVRGISLGRTRNKNADVTMYLYYGPWEVVDGSRYPNPWNMPNL